MSLDPTLNKNALGIVFLSFDNNAGMPELTLRVREKGYATCSNIKYSKIV